MGTNDVELREDAFVYRWTKLDLLFVIDDSCSMTEHQAALAVELPALVDELAAAELDWRAGFVTTSDFVDAGELIELNGARWVDDGTADADEALASFANVGTGGSSTEAGLDAAYAALETRIAANDGFVRVASQVAVVVVSDEADYSTDIQPPEFIEWLDAYRATPADTSFTAVVCTMSDATCSGETGFRYIEVAEATGGGVLSLNESLAPLGPGIASVHARLPEFELGMVPAPETLEVEVTPQDGEPLLLDPSRWSYDPGANVLRFDQGYTPPDKADVEVRYQPAGSDDESAP